MTEAFWGIRCVWLRYFDVFKKSWPFYLVTTFLEPLMYILSFGLGLGSMVGEVQTHGTVVSYRRFVLAGIVGQTLLFQGFFEAAYGGFVRMYYQRIFHAMATTPITLSEVLWGELLWDASKATAAAVAVLIIASLLGDFHPSSILLVLPLCFAFGFLFSALGMTAAAYSRSIDHLSYPQYLFIFPMFLFCGVFYPVENLPEAAQAVAWILPLTPVLSLVRTLTLGLPLQWQAIPSASLWLAVMLIWSRRSMTTRLVK